MNLIAEILLINYFYFFISTMISNIKITEINKSPIVFVNKMVTFFIIKKYITKNNEFFISKFKLCHFSPISNYRQA